MELSDYTTKNGLLYKDGKMLGVREADAVARYFKFVYAENMVKHLESLKEYIENKR